MVRVPHLWHGRIQQLVPYALAFFVHDLCTNPLWFSNLLWQASGSREGVCWHVSLQLLWNQSPRSSRERRAEKHIFNLPNPLHGLLGLWTKSSWTLLVSAQSWKVYKDLDLWGTFHFSLEIRDWEKFSPPAKASHGKNNIGSSWPQMKKNLAHGCQTHSSL